jgi:hypothetical protein
MILSEIFSRFIKFPGFIHWYKTAGILLISFVCKPVFLSGQSNGDFRSIVSGTWTTASNWETYNGTSWVAAGASPTNASGVITIQSPNTMTVSANLTVDQVVINSGATMQTTGAVVLAISNTAGIQLQINGTFIDGSTANVTFGANARWAYGTTGTLVKATGSSATVWQSNYSGGASTMPSTANWISRKTAGSNPALVTIGGYYPNLIIENNVAGTWTTAAGSTFNGTTGFPTIKGNLDIGGSGTSTVNFLNQHTFSTATLVQGDLIIRSGNTLSNNGTGIEVQGNITANGTLSYSGTTLRKIIFSGSNSQSINGAGTLNVYNMTMNKSGGTLTLNRSITIDNILTLTNGVIYTTSANLLTINTSGSVASASNSSFVSGPVRYVGYSAFTYPIGKGSDYQSLSIGASAGGGTFYTETFDASACPGTSGCDPSLVGWTSVSLGGEGSSANRFYVSCRENGNAAGACGSGCGSDQSLHVGNVSTSAAAGFWCPNGDCGASYDASGSTEITNKRAESGVINCTGRSNITVSFNYIENGQGASDNATFWYYDGTSWSQLDDMPKTVLCGGQGTWTNRVITLPSSADNNTNVKIGFVWVNNGDGTGSDPSFAVDDITLYTSLTVDFTAEYFYADPQTTFNNTLDASLASISSCEYWTLTRNAGSESKNITLSWDGNSCAVSSVTDLRVAHWDGTTWQNEGNTATTGTTAAGTITSNAVTWFSPFTISSVTSGPLPIELIHFSANYNGVDVDLRWETATEINNDFFTVERSPDASDFTEIVNVKGAGNSNEILNYKTKDKSPLSGLSYYRLKQTDFDGKTSYSNIVPINVAISDFEIVNTYHFAEEGVLEITISCSNDCLMNIELFDVIGKKVFSSTENTSGNKMKVYIPDDNLKQGIYLLKVLNENKVISKKIIF